MIPSAGCHLLIYIINVRHSIGESLCDTYCPKPLEIELSVQGVAKTVNSSTEVFTTAYCREYMYACVTKKTCHDHKKRECLPLQFM